jgi:N-acetylmuramoyl-L-alanine amidase
LNTAPGLLRSAAVARFRIWLTIAFALSAMIGTYLCAQGNDEEDRKREQFLKTREAEASPTASPKTQKPKNKTISSPDSKKVKPTATPKAKSAKKKESETEEAKPKSSEKSEPSTSPKPKKSSSSTVKSKSTKKKSVAKKEATPKKKGTAKTSGAKAKESAASEEIPKAVKAVSPSPMATPIERSAAPLSRAVVAPAPTIAPIEEEPAQVNIEKSGYEKPAGFFARLFGGGGRSSGGGNYRYLTSSIRAQIDHAPVMPRRWQYIIVHNSGTRQGNAAAFDYYHRHVRRMQNGLAYHFVIGNGTSTRNGQVEIGDRWRRQINGGHVHSDYLNNIALGICLVGDFNRDQPTRAQLDCCEELIRYLRQRCGKIDNNHYAIVRPHREVNPPRWATDCPGDAFPYSWFRRFQE